MEIAGIAGGKRALVGRSNAGDLKVGELDGYLMQCQSTAPGKCGQARCGSYCRFIIWQDARTKSIDCQGNGSVEPITPSAGREGLNPELELENGNC